MASSSINRRNKS